jgi:hypothetical protein
MHVQEEWRISGDRTTFFFIVMWLMLFRVFFLIALGCPGLCLYVLLICMIVGSPLVGLRELRCRKWCLCTSFGVYERK